MPAIPEMTHREIDERGIIDVGEGEYTLIEHRIDRRKSRKKRRRERRRLAEMRSTKE